MFHWITLGVVITLGVTGGNFYGGQQPSPLALSYPQQYPVYTGSPIYTGGPVDGGRNNYGGVNKSNNPNLSYGSWNKPLSFASPGRSSHAQKMPNRSENVDNSAVLGYIAKSGQFPFQVSIEVNGRHFCGGTILAPIIILTAAHCVYQQPVMSMNILAGTIDRQKGGIRTHIGGYKTHPSYNPTTKDFDIAIIFLKAPLAFSKYIQPAQLPKQDEQLYSNAMVTISGWGGESGNGRIGSQLKFIHAPLMDHRVCKANFNLITNTMICVGELNGQRNSCPGDSGGPLTMGNMVIGVMSWSFGCNAPGKPTVYSYIAGARQWIGQVAMV